MTIEKKKNKITFKLIAEILVGFLVAAIAFVYIANFLEYILFLLLTNQGSFLKIAYKYLLPASTISFSVLVIALSNPIYALLCLIVVFINMVLLLLSIKVEFLAMLYLIIYLGAIAILFLFVIMMFNFKDLQINTTKEKFWSTFTLFSIISIKFYYIVLYQITNFVNYSSFFGTLSILKTNDIRYAITYKYNDIYIFTNLFFTYYSYLFLICGMLLLTSMVGSIVLALSTVEPLAIEKKNVN
jgi:NADH:ubiquinone oxidoreductase subunit 6 (subunit J)